MNGGCVAGCPRGVVMVRFGSAGLPGMPGAEAPEGCDVTAVDSLAAAASATTVGCVIGDSSIAGGAGCSAAVCVPAMSLGFRPEEN
jgi:hypothetical protein